MKRLLSLLFLVLLLSCTKSIYHVASVQSEQVKSVDNDFIFENEHVKFAYNLWEKGGRMRFLVFNKTNQPLYIDWANSSLVRNGARTAYSQLPPLPKKAYTDTVRYAYQGILVEPYRMTARTSRLAEIPPQTYVAIADFPIQQTVLRNTSKDQVFTYTRLNSPLRVGQQLTYSFDKTLTDAHRVEHSFWVDKIQVVRIGELTRLYGSLEKGRPNALYSVEKRPAPGKTLLLVGGITTGGVLYLIYLSQHIFDGVNLCC